MTDLFLGLIVHLRAEPEEAFFHVERVVVGVELLHSAATQARVTVQDPVCRTL